MADALRVTVWNEGVHEKTHEAVRKVYPDGIHTVIANGLREQGYLPFLWFFPLESLRGRRSAEEASESSPLPRGEVDRADRAKEEEEVEAVAAAAAAAAAAAEAAARTTR